MSGLTQRALAAELGVTTRSLMNYEGGVTVPYKHLERIGLLTHTNRAWLLHGSAPRTFGETVERLSRAMETHRALVKTQSELRTQSELLLERTERGWTDEEDSPLRSTRRRR